MQQNLHNSSKLWSHYSKRLRNAFPALISRFVPFFGYIQEQFQFICRLFIEINIRSLVQCTGKTLKYFCIRMVATTSLNWQELYYKNSQYVRWPLSIQDCQSRQMISSITVWNRRNSKQQMCFPAISDLLLDLLRSQLFRENVRLS